jgi:LacI family transcriptional regulator
MADNHGAMKLAVDHLVQLGHRRIVHIGGPLDHCDAHERRAGFTAAMKAHGLEHGPDSIYDDGWTQSRHPESLLPVMDRGFTAFVCSNDIQAERLMKIARDQGSRVPGDLSIIGMDDVGPAAEHGITTITNPLREIGRSAVDSLMALLAGEPAKEHSRIIPVELVVRHTTAPVNAY